MIQNKAMNKSNTINHNNDTNKIISEHREITK